jgi:hypothetical protein
MRAFDLFALEGTWNAEETLHPSPWQAVGGAAEATLTAQLALGGKALLQAYRREGRFAYEGVGVLLRDAASFELWWFDALEAPGPAKGGATGGRLVLERKSPMGKARYTYELVRDGEFTFRIEHSRNGRVWQPFLDARYLRRPPPPAPPPSAGE